MRTATLLMAVIGISLAAFAVLADECTLIEDGILEYSGGHYLGGTPLETGYDIFGYNYQAHQFRGYYCNVYLGGAGLGPYAGDAEAYLSEWPEAENHWAWPYRDVKLIMKWNDAWLSNMDCDGDGRLDRYYGHDTYIGSGAWETNHQSGEYYENGEKCKWTYYVKIIAAPVGAYKEGGYWFTEDGDMIGSVIWGSFAILQQVSNDPCMGDHGVIFKGARPGFGDWEDE